MVCGGGISFVHPGLPPCKCNKQWLIKKKLNCLTITFSHYFVKKTFSAGISIFMDFGHLPIALKCTLFFLMIPIATKKKPKIKKQTWFRDESICLVQFVFDLLDFTIGLSKQILKKKCVVFGAIYFLRYCAISFLTQCSMVQ